MMRIRLRSWVAMVLCAAIFSSAAASTEPQEVVARTTDELLAALKSDKAEIEKNPEHVYGLVRRIALPHFDFERISQWVLAKYWRTATEQQRQRFQEEFTSLLVRTYATALTEYTGQQIKLEPVRMKPGDTEVKVRAEVEQPGAFPIPIDYRMYLKDGSWKVYDVAIDEISLVANYRTTFANEIRAGSLDALIETLASRNKSGAGR